MDLKASRFCVFLALILITVPAVAGDQSAMDWVTNVANDTRAWLDGRLSTPGTSAEAREISRNTDHGRLLVQYNLFVKGAAKDQLYSLLEWPVSATAPSETMKGLSLSSEGEMICAGRKPEQCNSPEGKDDPVDLTFFPEKGEIYRLGLVSADSQTKIFFTIVPDPIIKTEKGCSLEVIRLMPNSDIVMIRGKGYKPNEDLQFTSKSYDENRDKSVKADGNGEYINAMLPFVKGRQSGTTNVRLKGTACAPTVSFQWGK